MLRCALFARPNQWASKITTVQYFATLANEVPIIRIPKYLENSVRNSIAKEHQKAKKTLARKRNDLDPAHANKLIISSSSNKKLNHYYGYRYDPKNMQHALITNKWIKHNCNGETLTFHKFAHNPSILEVMKNENKTFKFLGLDDNIISSIYEITNRGEPVNPSAIQFGVIPFILQNKNVILSAETGSGKTIAYMAPLIQMIEQEKKLNTERKYTRAPLALVLLPSRELTEQVGEVARKLASNTGVGVATMIGGLPKNITHTGLDIVISTIGLVKSHLERGIYKLDRLKHIVLDEADTMLDDTFSSETMDLLENLNFNSAGKEVTTEEGEKVTVQAEMGAQLICVSATMPSSLDSTIGALINLTEDAEKVTTKSLHTIHPNVKHVFYRINRYERDVKLLEFLKEDARKKRCTLIFANRSKAANWLAHFLNENDMPCRRLTSEMSEEERFHSFNAFQSGECDILVSTDLGSRGLDTTRVNHVINYDCPHYVADYIHRAGRTGRLGTKGSCLVSTLAAYKPDVFMLMALERSIRLGREITCTDANIKAQIGQRWADKWNKKQRDA